MLFGMLIDRMVFLMRLCRREGQIGWHLCIWPVMALAYPTSIRGISLNHSKDWSPSLHSLNHIPSLANRNLLFFVWIDRRW